MSLAIIRKGYSVSSFIPMAFYFFNFIFCSCHTCWTWHSLRHALGTHNIFGSSDAHRAVCSYTGADIVGGLGWEDGEPAECSSLCYSRMEMKLTTALTCPTAQYQFTYHWQMALLHLERECWSSPSPSSCSVWSHTDGAVLVFLFYLPWPEF